MVEVVSDRHRPRWWSRLVVAIVFISVAAGVGTSVARSVATTSPWPFDLHTVGIQCAEDPAWVCGSIQAPLDRDVRGSSTISVDFRVLPRRITARAPIGTIVVVNGGPGDSSIDQASWAQSAFRSLLADHDLLLVDNRGSGTSDTIDCPQLQKTYSKAAMSECRKILGSAVDDFSTVAAVDDLEAVLTRVHARAVDLYGESYGTFFAQAFALRYPRHLQRLVLDGALTLNADPWQRDSVAAGLAGLRTTCRADPTCRASGDPTPLVGRVLAQLRVGTPPGQVSAGVQNMVYLLGNAGRAGGAYRELPAALRAYLAGNVLPLFRLLDESYEGAAGSDAPAVMDDSVGLEVADDCADEPQAFDLHASLAVQKRELAAAFKRVASADAKAVAPFTAQEALPDQTACLGWPAPTHTTPQELGHNFPDMPTLVLEGSLDTVTPAPGARAVASEFRGSRYVEVPFVGHVTAVNDRTGCAASIAAQFMATATVDTRCLARDVAEPQVDEFPLTFYQEPPLVPIGKQGVAGLSDDDRRTVAVARDTIADVLWRWAKVGEVDENGLWAGTAKSGYTGVPGLYRIHLDGIGWTFGVTVSGDIDIEFHVDRGIDKMNATVDVASPAGPAQLAIRAAHVRGPSTVETISGTVDGHKINVTVDSKLGL